ncbi:HAAAP family serine/threonine permease [Corynebacterium sp. H128]|uniref:HAAAP family serine/threonine permease n=1 Tax=unclassified Corynebacterium TaxID=2624378 RepID=UPI0030B071CF
MSIAIKPDGSKMDDAPSANSSSSAPKWNKGDTVWMLSLFGTAIGAGVLFLPINAGVGGIIPLLIMTFVAFPMTFWAHRGLTRFVLSSSSEGGDLTEAVEEHFGPKAGMAMTILYFLSVYPILLVYSVTITNTVASFMQHQLHMAVPPRGLLSLILVGGLIVIVRFGANVVVKVMSVLVFPFIAILVALSLYLIPQWTGALFTTFNLESVAAASGHGLAVTLLLLVPVMVFSFNHSPIISSFAKENKKIYGAHSDKKTGKILAAAELLMVVVVMLFVFSTALSLTPANIAEAKEQNITILSYLANHFDDPVIGWVAPIVAIIAVAKSFLGHYLGAAEGFEGIVKRVSAGKGPQGKALETFTLVFMLVTAWLTGWANPSILGMIETLCGPTIAILLFLLPQYAMMKVPALKRFSGHFSNYFVWLIGFIAAGTIVYNIIQAF